MADGAYRSQLTDKREAPADAEHLVSVVQPASYNLRTRFERIVRRAGLRPWPRLFHNLRASCSTDFAQSLPNHEAARFMGHSPLIAAAHYLQPSDHNFRAVAGEGPWITESNGDETSTIEGGE
jgi:integrase